MGKKEVAEAVTARMIRIMEPALRKLGSASVKEANAVAKSIARNAKKVGKQLGRTDKIFRQDLAKLFKNGRVGKASELDDLAKRMGLRKTQTPNGPPKYVDANGVPRITIKSGSSRAPGSAHPHVELKDPTGQRIDPFGNPVNRRDPGNHTPIDLT